MARIDSRVRCCRPQPTTYSTASHTLSQDVWNDSAVSFQESLRAQRARNSMWARVNWCLPSHQGTSSTTTPQLRHSTRRMRYSQEHQKTPQRNELEASLGKMIVTRCRLVTPRTDCRRARPRPDVDFDA